MASEADDAVRRCRSCGTEVGASEWCPNCGAYIAWGDATIRVEGKDAVEVERVARQLASDQREALRQQSNASEKSAAIGASTGEKAFHIFISYRREGTGAHAGRLYDSLLAGVDDQSGFDREQIFMDVDTLRPGVDFRESIRSNVATCDVLLAVIGKRWTTARDQKRQRRLDDPGDYVRIEIEAALERNIPVIPVLVDDAAMPREADLPSALSALAYRHAVQLGHASWRSDIARLLASLKQQEQEAFGQASRSRGTARHDVSPDPAEATLEEVMSRELGARQAEIDRELRAMAKAHPVVDGRVTSIHDDHAEVFLDQEPTGKLLGKRVGAFLETTEGSQLRVLQPVRVRIDDFDGSSWVLTLVELLPDSHEKKSFFGFRRKS